MRLRVGEHPLLDLGAFTAELPVTLGEAPSPDWLRGLLAPGAAAPLAADDAVRAAVRDVLRRFGYKPTGRGKPASEYLLRAAGEGALASINLAVDACNAVSLHSGLPIERGGPGPRATAALAGDRRRGRALRVQRLGPGDRRPAGCCASTTRTGPCANAVKDAQRTKTHAGTRRILALVWGARALGDRTRRAAAWYRELCERAGARTEEVELEFVQAPPPDR